MKTFGTAFVWLIRIGFLLFLAFALFVQGNYAESGDNSITSRLPNFLLIIAQVEILITMLRFMGTTNVLRDATPEQIKSNLFRNIAYLAILVLIVLIQELGEFHLNQKVYIVYVITVSLSFLFTFVARSKLLNKIR